jgi:anti-anti-sigma factor
MDVRMDVEVLHPAKAVAVVECRGDHDLTTRQELADLLHKLLRDNALVVVDVSDAELIDSSFVNNMFIANGLARRYGKRFRLQVATAPTVSRVLEISGILGELDCVGDREEALR